MKNYGQVKGRTYRAEQPIHVPDDADDVLDELGVRRQGSKFVAAFTHCYKRYYVGTYDTRREAVIARREAMKKVGIR